MSDLTKVSLADASKQLGATIRSAFVELLSEEQWHAMIRTELARFTEPGRDYQGKQTDSELTKACRAVFMELVREKVKAFLETEEFQAPYGQVSVFIREWLTAHAKELIESTILSLAGDAAQRVFVSMRGR